MAGGHFRKKLLLFVFLWIKEKVAIRKKVCHQPSGVNLGVNMEARP